MLLRALAPILFLIILFSPATSDAQQDAKVYRVGFILTTSPVSEMVGRQPKHTGINMFLRELESLGYIEGRNLVLERRSAEGKAERYGDIVADLVRLNMDVIVTLGNSMTQRAKEVTTTVPIVMILGVDPVRAGIVQSLAHPGGNVTGFSIEAGAELYAKRLALLKEAAPKVARVAFLGSAEDWEGIEGRSVRAAAEQLRLNIFPAEATANDFGAAFAEIERGRANAVFVASSAPHFVHRKRIVDFVTRKRLPNTHHYRSSVEVGGLMSYGADTSEQFRSSAGYVNKILRGAKPGDLPMEQPTKFELVINLNAAMKLGLTIPSSLLLQAERVIE